MSYANIAKIANDVPLSFRLIACAAQQGKPAPYEPWVSDRRWRIAASPGWAASWASALAADPEADPGANEACITDEMILAVIQPMD